MHRHLLGLTSPAADFVPEAVSTNLALPEHWDGDAWVKASGCDYFLRAWNVATGRVAYGKGAKFVEAHHDLLAEITEGTRRVKISILESKPV